MEQCWQLVAGLLGKQVFGATRIAGSSPVCSAITIQSLAHRG